LAQADVCLGFLFVCPIELNQAVEELARVHVFLSELKKGMPPDLAAERVQQALFHYRSVTPFEKYVLSRLIPFYKFSRKNLELQARALLSAPGRLAIQHRIMNALEDALEEEPLDEDTMQTLPPHVRQGLGIVLRTKEGGVVSTINSLRTPFESAMETAEAFVPVKLAPEMRLKSLQEGFLTSGGFGLQATSSLIRVPFEVLANVRVFGGFRQIGDTVDITSLYGLSRHIPPLAKTVDLLLSPRLDVGSGRVITSHPRAAYFIAQAIPGLSRATAEFGKIQNEKPTAIAKWVEFINLADLSHFTPQDFVALRQKWFQEQAKKQRYMMAPTPQQIPATTPEVLNTENYIR